MLRTVCNLLKVAVVLTLFEFSQNALLVMPQTGVAPDSGTGHLGGSDQADVRRLHEVRNLREQDHPSSGWELLLRDTGEVMRRGRLEEAQSIPPPSSVKLEFINISAVQISWSYPFEDVPTPIQFILQCSKDGQPYQNASDLLNITQFVYGHMLLSAYYQFRVVAYHGGVASEPSQPSYSFLNGITAPPGPPINVKATAVSYNEIELVWDPPFPAPPTPLIYLMFWGTNPEDLIEEDSVMGETHWRFQSLSPGQIYFFQLRADISGHLSIPSPTVNVTTKGAVLPGVTITDWNVSAYWVWLSWSAPPLNRYPLTISNFTVYYQQTLGELSPGSRDQFCCKLTVGSDVLEANVTGLQPDTVYVFTVGYASREFQSDRSEQKILITTDSLQCFSCKPLSSTELKVKWKTSSSGIQRVVIFETVGTNRQRIIAINATGDVDGYTITNLHPWTKYTFVIMLQDSTGRDVYDSECPPTECRTKEDAPSQPPTGFQVSRISPTDATLTWSPPAPLTQNGILTYYLIAYKCSPRGTWQQCTTKQIVIPVQSRETVTHTIEGLTPFTLYSFQVAAETTAGRGPFSAPAFNTTKEDVPTGTPENLSVIEITDRSATLMWDPPPPQSQNGIILGYVIFYAAVDRPTDPRLTVSRTPFLTIGNDLQDSETFENSSGTPDCTLLEVAGTKGKINNLRPLTSYSVSVAAKTVAGIGPSSTALRVQTLKSVVRLTVDVNFSAEVIKSNDSHICFNIIFSWTPLFTVDGKSELLLRGNVTALTWNCNISYMGPTTHDVQQGFIKVDGNSTVSRFLPSANMYSGLLSGTDYLFWLSVGTKLSNGTFLYFESTATELEIPLCEGSNNIWRVVAITVASTTVASLVLVTCGIIACCLRKYRKRRSTISHPTILTDSYQYEEVQDSLHILMPDLRRSDGRSTSSSDADSEESRSSSPTSTSQDSSSCSMVLNAEETSPLLDSIAKERFQRALPANANSNANVEILCIPTETQTLGQLPLEHRQDPDGCSLSSSSSESNLLQSSP